jgi:hypothetical protein
MASPHAFIVSPTSFPVPLAIGIWTLRYVYIDPLSIPAGLFGLLLDCKSCYTFKYRGPQRNFLISLTIREIRTGHLK